MWESRPRELHFHLHVNVFTIFEAMHDHATKPTITTTITMTFITPHRPDYPPPSYDDATNSSSVPLLAGAPPGYGTTFPDQSSIASSDLEDLDRSLPEWIGQALAVFVFISITYAFWRIINAPQRPDGFPEGPGHFG
ncbi:hypothetical protein SNOG_12055 [Parastagonospora nodorum SN15]|uniref:Uncharacterized protein n=1 Tax=Phaeosphaeria nodorum (strain SN15 / ATCC MYA-4574 / FGSC 10173) TaxID=321614 RepID=Q0U859_PHANO|nr:hypothetical protein SNOG_12055 [Parastagonospora nodorum SN15]EAT80467.1 hypothetical protein SNOG_12055 [Parastagonospora nodorum SN15]